MLDSQYAPRGSREILVRQPTNASEPEHDSQAPDQRVVNGAEGDTRGQPELCHILPRGKYSRHIHLIRAGARAGTADPSALAVYRIVAAGHAQFRESTP